MNSKEKKSLINRFVEGKEDALIVSYVEDGPTSLKEELGLCDEDWRVIFDYLVFEHNLLFICAVQCSDFFVDEYIKGGATQVREILDVVDPKYDMPFEVVFDFLAVSKDGLYYHVIENRDRYMLALRARGSEFVRKVLGVWKEKYEESWARVLDFLLHSACEAIFSEQTFNHGIKAFSRIMNGLREHRPIYKSGLII